MFLSSIVWRSFVPLKELGFSSWGFEEVFIGSVLG